MIKYFINEGMSRMGRFNTETEEFDTIKYSIPRISDMYIAPEDGTLNGKEVHKGDIVLQMYSISGDGEQEIFIIADDNLKNYYIRAKEFDKQKSVNNRIACDCAEPYSGR